MEVLEEDAFMGLVDLVHLKISLNKLGVQDHQISNFFKVRNDTYLRVSDKLWHRVSLIVFKTQCLGFTCGRCVIYASRYIEDG